VCVFFNLTDFTELFSKKFTKFYKIQEKMMVSLPGGVGGVTLVTKKELRTK